jgi:hypothetical protein
MSLSGSNTGALLPYTAQNLLEEACSRAGIPPEGITGEIVYKFLDQLNLCFTSLLNRGIQLWKRQQLILPTYINVNQVPLPAGYNVVTTLNRRSLFRATTTPSSTPTNGTPFSDAGGDANAAFDDDFATACVQTTPNGAIGYHFDQPGIVTNVGVLSGTSGTFALFFEYSNDGTDYTAVDAATVTFAAAGEWAWFDLSGTPQGGALYWRVRSVGDVPFAAEEIFFGNTPQEINLGMWNLDDFSNMPNKNQGGQVVNWYQQRNVSAPVLYVWPTPNNLSRYDTLVVWATQYLDQVTRITQGLDLPPRWYDAITADVAFRCCRSFKEADKKLLPFLKEDRDETMSLAQAEERDPAPTNYDLGVSNYTA